MEEPTELIFMWRNVLFAACVKDLNLNLKWKETTSVARDSNVLSSQADTKEEEGRDIPSCSHRHSDTIKEIMDVDPDLDLLHEASPLEMFDCNAVKQEPSKCCNTSLKMNDTGSVHLVKAGSSFDQMSLQNIPVLLVICGDPKEGLKQTSKHRSDEFKYRTEYLLVGVRDSSPNPFFETPTNVAYPSAGEITGQSMLPQFTLAPLRSWSIEANHRPFTSSSFQNNIAFLSDFQLLLLDPIPTSVSVKFCTQFIASSQFLVQDFDLVSSGSVSDVNFLDVFSVLEDETFVALVSLKEDTGKGDIQTRCLCCKFAVSDASTSSVATSNIAENYEMLSVPLEILFSPEHAEILKCVSISSFSCKYNKLTKSSTTSTRVTMITHTGYALRFADGVMCCCINLEKFVYRPEPPLEDWTRLSVVKAVSFDFERSHDRTAIQIDSACLLCNWTEEKITRVWSSVSNVASCDVQRCGIPSLILISVPENDITDVFHWYQRLDEVHVAVINVNDDADERHNNCPDDDGNEKDGADIRGHMPVGEDNTEQPQCAVNAVLAQHKRCQSAVREAKAELSSKVSFLTDTWQRLSQLDINGTCSSSVTKSCTRGPPLTCLVEGSLPPSHSEDSSRSQVPGHSVPQQVRKYFETGDPWRRFVDSVMVVGLTVRNISESSLGGIFLQLIPANSSLPVTVKFTTKYDRQSFHMTKGPEHHSCMGSSSFKKRKLVQDKTGTCLDPSSLSVLSPRDSIVITCSIDISQCFGASDLRFHIFVSGWMVDGKERCDPKALTSRVEEHCGEFVLTSHDVLSETHAVGRSEGTSKEGIISTLEDLLALDSVQSAWTLIIQGVVSSVTSLSSKLTAHPSITHLDWVGQFIFTANHQLRFCRVQVLELTSKYKGLIQVFARSEFEALLFIKFLYTLLAEDITILLHTSPQAEVAQPCQTVIQETESKTRSSEKNINILKAKESSTSKDTVQDEGEVSPQFHSKKGSKTKSKFEGKVTDRPETIQIESEGKETSANKAGTERREEVLESNVQEMEEMKRARKRLREKWGQEMDEG